MKKTFKDRLTPKEDKEGDMPWNFTTTEYDKRSSSFISAGCDYGVGVNQPIGSLEASDEPGVPIGCKSITIDNTDTWR